MPFGWMKTEVKSNLIWLQYFSFCVSLSSFLTCPSNEDYAVVERGGIGELGIYLFFVPTPIKYGQC